MAAVMCLVLPDFYEILKAKKFCSIAYPLRIINLTRFLATTLFRPTIALFVI